MNKSKRIKRVEAEVGVHDKKKDKLVNQKVLAIASIVFVIILVGALIFDQLYESTLLTIDGKKYHLDDLSYYIYNTEYQYNYYDQMFGGSGTYWNMSADESGRTMRDIAKEEAIDTAIYNEVLYGEAVAEGYTLTEEEKTSIEANVTNMMDAMSPGTIRNADFTKESLTESLGKTTLVARYRQDKIDALDIDDEGITAGISREEYRQYDIEYLFASKMTTDAQGNSIAKTSDDQAAALAALNTYYDKAKTTEDWSTLLPEDEKLVTYRTDNFTPSDTIFEEDFKAQIMTMENNAVGEVYETDTGYYVVRMINNNSSQSYDTAVTNAITEAENEAFNELYDEILAKHEYQIHDSALKSLTMGNITLSIY